MYAIVRENRFDVDKVARGEEQLAEFQEIHAQQPGYGGTIVVDAGEGLQLSINLWDAEEDANAALPVMVPAVRRLIEPMLVAPSRVIAAGRVALTDLVRGPSATRR